MASPDSIPVGKFKALADPTRLQILLLLDGSPRSVSEIVDFFSLSQPTISRHLASLAGSGLVKTTRREQQRIYSLDEKGLKSLLTDYFARFSGLKKLVNI
jgi:DNA-binding transcriptional ArsR family regulator